MGTLICCAGRKLIEKEKAELPAGLDIEQVADQPSVVNDSIHEFTKSLLEAIRYVDLVIPEENWEQKVSDIKEYHVDTFVMGDDWEGKFDFLKPYCDVVYLPRTPEISTTQIKADLQK